MKSKARSWFKAFQPQFVTTCDSLSPIVRLSDTLVLLSVMLFWWCCLHFVMNLLILFASLGGLAACLLLVLGLSSCFMHALMFTGLFFYQGAIAN